MAGGRISGVYARAAGTRVKALVPVAGAPAVCRVVDALRSAGLGRVVVVGPEAVRDALGGTAEWAREAGPALANLEAGRARLLPRGEERVLVCGGYVPA